MAEIALTFLSPLIEGAILKTISLCKNRIGTALGLEKELNRLCRFLQLIQSVVQLAEERQESDPAIKCWLQDLKDVAYEAVDALDECEYRVLRRRVKNRGPLSFSPRFLDDIALKVKHITKQLSDLKDWADTINLLVSLRDQTCPMQYPKTDSFPDNARVFGREDDVSKILTLLLDLRHQHSQHPISGISIVGMAGVGKTTVAKLVYMKAKEGKHYDLVAWVCISEDFNEQIIFGEMLRHFNGTVAPTNNINALLEDLAKELEGKAFLLILDDVWNEDPKKWDSFSSRLLKILKTNGSSIVATTRSEKVASAMESIPMQSYKMLRLSNDECWLIIKEKFLRSSGETFMPPNLEAIGHDIAKKCGGLPLVASVIGGTLSCQADAGTWKNIRDDKAWNFNSKDGGEIMSILKVSFDHLPSPLKKCFSYCSIFPKDVVIQKDDLVQLWMAVGFLDQSNEGKLSNESLITTEDIGNGYLDHLLANSLFQDVERDILGNIKSCKMHDVVHDLAMFVSKSETLILKNGLAIEKSCSLHLRVPCSVEVDRTSFKVVAPKLHSLFSKVDLCEESRDLKSIRSLSLKGANVDKLPASLGKLKHLRYLDVSETNIKALPKSFTKLYNLQTLRLIGCDHLQKLPDDFRNLISLKHFYFDKPNLMPKEMGNLTSLQTLPLFVVGKEREYWINELGPLVQLGGALRICNLQFVRSQSEATRADLEHKTKLHELKFEWIGNEGFNHHEKVLEGLQPHPNLRSLEINEYKGEKFPSWLDRDVNFSGNSSLLNNLLELKFNNCGKCTNIPNCLGLLRSLQVLIIDGMRKVKCMGSKFNLNRSKAARGSRGGGKLITLFPALKELRICNMSSLEEWAEIEDMVVFPCLEILQIDNCCSLKTWSMGGFSSHHKLSDLRISLCWNLMAIPNIDGLLSLKRLSVFCCKKLICLPSGLRTCISLQSLSIQYCSNLISIVEDIGRLHLHTDSAVYDCEKLVSFSKECLGHLTHLKRLNMGPFYSELEEFPGFTSIYHLNASLETLELSGWDKLKSLPHQLQHLTTLKELKLWNFNGLEALPEWLGNLSSLATLRIENCNKLKRIPKNIEKLRSLTVLMIRNCKELRSFPEECLDRLTNLKELQVGPFWSELEEFPGFASVSHLHTSLEILQIAGWDKLKSPPHQLQYLTTLRELKLIYFESLKALPEWFQNLSSLQYLGIGNCPNLMYLPSVEAKRHSSLQCLDILNCPKLRKRFAEDQGPEWSKISHIPHINIRETPNFLL